MTTLILARDTEAQQIWESITKWLDTIYAAKHHSHRDLYRLEGDLEMLSQELYELDRDLMNVAPSPAETVALHAMHLRYRDIEATMVRKWSSDAVRSTALRAMRGIHERFLGPIASTKETPVVYAVSRMSSLPDVSGFIEAYRIERNGIFVRRDDRMVSCSTTAVHAPLWTWDVLDALAGTPHKPRPGDAAMRAHYNGRNGYREDDYSFWVETPVSVDIDDVTELLTLWDPADEESPFRGLPETAEALGRL